MGEVIELRPGNESAPAPDVRRAPGRVLRPERNQDVSHGTSDNCRVTVRYLSLQDVAARIGVSRNTVQGYKLPEPDVIVGSDFNARRGWLPETIDEWNRNRPGRGARTDLRSVSDGDARG